MAKIIYGHRIAKTASMKIGCSAAIIYDDKILLTRRTDNNQWCLPGGGLENGESVSECCIREVLEETGLRVSINKLVGVYSNPDIIVEYIDKKRFYLVALHFDVKVIEGNLKTNHEVSEFGYFSLNDIDSLEVLSIHRERIRDSFRDQGQKKVFLR